MAKIEIKAREEEQAAKVRPIAGRTRRAGT